MTYVLGASTLIGGVLLVLLTIASGNSALFTRHYPLLLTLNLGVALAVLGLVGYQIVILARALIKRKFGSRLTLRLLLMFALMALAPGALIYTVSVQFLAKSIESWFDVKVDSALEGGLNLGRAALDSMLEELTTKARVMALDLSDLGSAQQAVALNRVREQTGVEEALLIGPGGVVVASTSSDFGRLAPDMPPAAIQRQARQSRGYRAIESSPEGGLKLRVLAPLAAYSLAEEPRLLQLTQTVPATLAANAEAVQSVYRDYKELSLSRQGLKEIYILTLTLTLLLTLFTALALAFILSRRLSEPLARLAQGTEAVARGDFSQRAQVTSADELGILTRSFNSMTEQLDEARNAAERGRRQVEAAHAHLENILANLSAGVLVLDRTLALQIANAGAARILGVELNGLLGARLDTDPKLAPLASAIRKAFKDGRANEVWQREVEFGSLMLLVRGSRLPVERGSDYVVVFDDVTQIIEAQRATAWAEVAQRLAHEIKNPLTPIQLAAERMQMKLEARLSPEDAGTLRRATDTIINQVGALKNMVDEFRAYARLPAPKLSLLDLNALVNEVLTLYEHTKPTLAKRLAPTLPAVRADASQLRQVIHNLLQNAEQALASRDDAAIEIATEYTDGRVWLRVSDNGAGFPEAIIKRVFEPYVTTKPKGTGLGLAIVKKIVDEHAGIITVANRDPAAGGGATISIALPVSRAESMAAQAAA